MRHYKRYRGFSLSPRLIPSLLYVEAAFAVLTGGLRDFFLLEFALADVVENMAVCSQPICWLDYICVNVYYLGIRAPRTRICSTIDERLSKVFALASKVVLNSFWRILFLIWTLAVACLKCCVKVKCSFNCLSWHESRYIWFYLYRYINKRLLDCDFLRCSLRHFRCINMKPQW